MPKGVPTPSRRLMRFAQLLRDTDLSAQECGRRSGIGFCFTGRPYRIVREYRRYIGAGRWVDRKTGKVRPEICTIACAMEKTGLSVKTIRRRTAAQVIAKHTGRSHATLQIFSASDIRTLQKIGLHPPDKHGILTRKDVKEIRRRARQGETHTRIALDYPVTRRQISRIVTGERWWKVPTGRKKVE